MGRIIMGIDPWDEPNAIIRQANGPREQRENTNASNAPGATVDPRACRTGTLETQARKGAHGGRICDRKRSEHQMRRLAARGSRAIEKQEE